MIQLSDEQLNNLGKEALVVIVSSLQDQLLALQSQLNHANAQLSDNNRQIELLTEQIRIMNQRFFGRKSEAAISDVDGQISLFDSFNEAEYLNQEPSKEPEITEVIIPSYHRKKAVGKRESDLSGLPARIIEHTLSYLRVFLSDGNVPMDNNYAEQAIWPFTIGRKNFIMIESSTGAKASAILYSLVETAKTNMLNTFEYFNLLLTEIPRHMDDKDLRFIDDLLPWSPRVQKECPNRYKNS